MDNNTNTANQQDNTNVNGSANGNNAQNNDGNNGNSVVDYSKIEAMINKGVQQKENAILKSYFEQQGMGENDVKAAISEWKANKQTKVNEQEKAHNDLKANYEALQARLNEELINKQAFNDCLELGVDRNTIPYVIKSADFKDAFDEKGELKADVVRNAVEQVLKDVPAFKGTSKEDKGFKIGMGGEPDTTTETENALRKAFGLSPKK